MVFFLRFAPGLRIVATDRGLVAGVGANAGRGAAGGGRGSSGGDPLGYFLTLAGRPRPTPAVPQRALGVPGGPSPDQVARLHEITGAVDAFQPIVDLHRIRYPSAERPIAPLPDAPDVSTIKERYRAEALAEAGRMNRAEREAALKAADAAAMAEAREIARTMTETQAQAQVALDARWNALLANDPAAVLAALVGAFTYHAAPATVVSAAGGEASLVVLVPGPAVLPDRRPTLAESDRVTIRRLTPRETAALYRDLVAGAALVTVKQAFAAAPGLVAARVVVLRPSRPDVYGVSQPELIGAARLTRRALDRVRWADVTATEVIRSVATELLLRAGGTAGELGPLDLGAEPDLAALAAAVDLSGLNA